MFLNSPRFSQFVCILSSVSIMLALLTFVGCGNDDDDDAPKVDGTGQPDEPQFVTMMALFPIRSH